MEKQRVKKRDIGWFIGGAGIATTAMLIYRKYEMNRIGYGIARILTEPALLSQVQAQARKLLGI